MKITHIDHTGRVPDLIDAGFGGEIICTHATRALLTPMLRDGMSFSDRTDAHIRRLTGYSALADQQALCDWVAAMPEPPSEIRLVHGEPIAKTVLVQKLNIT